MSAMNATQEYRLHISFEPQCLNGVQPRGLASRIVAKEHTDDRRATKRERNCIGRHTCRPIERARDRPRAQRAQSDADGTSYQAEDYRLHQKLTKHIASTRANSLPEADLACSLCHRDEHDVHDSYPAHQ